MSSNGLQPLQSYDTRVIRPVSSGSVDLLGPAREHYDIRVMVPVRGALSAPTRGRSPAPSRVSLPARRTQKRRKA